MDYEKLYKEALERARQFSKKPYLEDSKDIVEYIFPELKEDEKISREITEFLVGFNNGGYERPNENTIDSWLFWLEKQGQQKPSWSEGDELNLKQAIYVCHRNGYTAVENWLKSIKENEKPLEEYNVPDTPIKDSEEVTSRMKSIDENLKPIAEFVIDYANWNLKKDEWNNPVATVPLFRVLDALVQKGKQYSEGCSVVDNNTEPKFKVGDWVTNNIETVQITGYDIDYGYQVNYKGDLQHRDTDIIKKEYYIWTIQDAKDGDVLVCIGKPGQEIGIIKEYVGKYGGCDKCFETYCFIDWDGIFRTGEYIGSKEIHPATKEQRDILKKAMADAGYTFDFEKKELKKIEQKPINKPKFKVKYAGSEYNVFETKVIADVTFYGIEDEPNHIDYVQADNCEIISGYGIKESGLSFPTKPVMFSEQNPAWSEEDEKMYKAISIALSLKDAKRHLRAWYTTPEEANDWIKSLKDRIQQHE